MPTSSPDPVIRQLLEQQPFLRRLARALTADTASADDLVQDANALVLRRRERASKAWLSTVLRNLAISEHRSRKRRLTREGRAARPESADPDLAEVDRRLDGQALLATELRRLPAHEARALALRYYDELDPREIADRLGVAEATVKTRLRRGLAALRTRLDDEHGRERWLAAVAPLAPVRLPATASIAPLALPWAWAVAALLLAALSIAVALSSREVAPADAVDQDLESSVVGSPSEVELTPSTAAPRRESSAANGMNTAAAESPTPRRSPERPANPAQSEVVPRQDRPLLSMKDDRATTTWSVLRVHVVAPTSDSAARMIVGRLDFEVEGIPRREVELRGSSPDSWVDMRVPAERELRVSARFDGYSTPAVTTLTAREGRRREVELAPRPSKGSAHLTLLLSPSQSVGADALEDGRIWLVRLTNENSLEMPMRKVRLTQGRLEYGRLLAGDHALSATPYSDVTTSATQGIDGRTEFTIEEGDALTIPVPARRTGTVGVTVRAPDGKRLRAGVIVVDPDGSTHRKRFRWPDVGAGSTTHGSVRSVVVPPFAPGPTKLRFTCEGYAPTEVDVIVHEGEITDLDVTLWPE